MYIYALYFTLLFVAMGVILIVAEAIARLIAILVTANTITYSEFVLAKKRGL